LVLAIVSAHTLTIDNLAVHYTRHGQGPPAVLVHGYAHAQTMWAAPLENYLKNHFCCYALDLPGHGQSDQPPLAWFTLANFTETLYQFCQQLKLNRFLLIGYSMGGLISLDLALRYPHLVERLITINAPVKGDFLAVFDPLLHLERLIQTSLAERLFRLYHRYSAWLAIPVELRRYAKPRMVFSPSCRRIQAEMGQCSVQTLFGNFKAIRFCDLSQKVATLQPPTLVITTDRDRVVPPVHAKFVAEQAPHAQLVVIPHCGHLPVDEQPALFAAALQEYLGLIATSRLGM
jgi:pimeloyl-ACP methyl ester carboxylesterase